MSEMNETSTDFPLPPASFTFLVESIMMQTQMQLGIFSLGDEDENAEPNFPIAQHSIELLAVLQDKTRGNLTVEERRILENGLTELRFRFLQVSEASKKRQQAEAARPLENQPIIVTADVGKGLKTS